MSFGSKADAVRRLTGEKSNPRNHVKKIEDFPRGVQFASRDKNTGVPVFLYLRESRGESRFSGMSFTNVPTTGLTFDLRKALRNYLRTMPTQRSDEKNVRKLTKLGGHSYGVTIPIEIIRKLGWQERQKLTVELNEDGDIVISD